MRAVVVLWLLALPVLALRRVPAWASDAALWSAAADVPPVSRRTWANLYRWDQLIQIDEQPRGRQPFSWRVKPIALPRSRGTWLDLRGRE